MLNSYSRNHIDTTITKHGGNKYRLTCFYGEPNRSKRKKTWDLMRNLVSLMSLPWCLIGDLNNVLY